MATIVTEPVLDAYIITYLIPQSTVMDAADITASAVMLILQSYIQNEYDILAHNYYTLYNNQRQFYYANFQAAGEAVLATQVFVNPLAGNGQTGIVYTPQYLQQATNVLNFDANGAFSSEWWLDHANVYNDVPFIQGHTPRGQTFGNGEPEVLDRASIIADFDTYMNRYEDHRKDVYDERTWEWQNQSLNFGLKQANVVESGLATSFKYLDEAAGNMADFFATQANGLATQAAYKKSYNQTAMQLAASRERGRGLAFGVNLGADRRNSDAIFNSNFESSSPRRAQVE